MRNIYTGRRSAPRALTTRRDLTGGWGRDVRFALRALRRRPGFTATAVLTFALGIGANAAMFSIIHALLLRPLPFDPEGRLVVIWEAHQQRGLDRYPVAPAKFLDWRRDARRMGSLAAYRVVGQNLVGAERAERVRVALVTRGFLDVLGAPPALGRGFVEDDFTPAPSVAVVARTFWERRFGGTLMDGIDAVLDLEGRRVRVVGIISDAAAKAIGVDVFVPFVIPNAESRVAHGLDVIGRLPTGVEATEAQREMDALAARLATAFPDTDRGWTVTVRLLRDHLVGDLRPSLLMLQAAVALVLLTAVANIAGLLLGHAAKRRHEVAVRIAMGASRPRVARLLVTEGMVLALLGAAVGTLAAQVGLGAIVRLAPADLPFADGIAINGPVLATLIAIAAVMGGVIGLAPAIQTLRGGVHPVLRDGHRSVPARQPGRRTLVVAQLSGTVVLLAGALLFLRSFAALRAVDPGFRTDHLITAQLRPSRTAMRVSARAAFYAGALERVRALPGVASAALVSHLPLSGESEVFRFLVDDRPAETFADIPTAEIRAVSPEYFATMGIRITRGRDLSTSDHAGSPPIALINETLARQYWPDRDPLLRSLSIDGAEGPWRTIVGVVDDVRHFGLDHAPRGEVYLPITQLSWPTVSLVARTDREPATELASIGVAVRAVDPTVPIERLQPMEAYIDAGSAGRRFEAWVLALFAASALGLALVGVYGVLNYSVAQRTNEFGIRMALGAETASVVRLVLREGAAMVGAGIAIGVAGTVAASRAVAGLLFAVDPLDFITFSAVAAIVALTALVAAYLPARRASQVDPATSLRAE